MSNEAMTWAFDVEGLTSTQKFLLVALADYADEEHSCYPGQKKLAFRISATTVTVSKNLAALERMGFIRRARRYKNGYRTSDRFVLAVGRMEPERLPKESLPKESLGKGSLHKDEARPYINLTPTLPKANRGAIEPLEEPLEEPLDRVADAPQPTPDGVRPDVQQLLDLLDDEMELNGSKRNGRLKRNQTAMRLLLDRDGKTPEQVAAAIRWSQSDEFWRSNILSASKLREKYDQMRLQAARARPPEKLTPTERAQRTLMLATDIDMGELE